MGAVFVIVMANRLLGRRTAILGTLAVLTSPLFVFLARQAVPDPIFVGLLEGAMACLMIVLFSEQIGFDCFPWVFAFPGAATILSRIKLRPQTARDRAMLFLLLWILIGFAVFGFSATKFHHYAFPILAPLLLFCAMWIEQLLEQGLRANAEAPQDRTVTVLALVGLSLAFAVFLGWYHWRKLSPHWTQRDLFWEYYHQSQPDEPIGAYQMNWRGEQFYSKNTVREIVRQIPPMSTLAEFMSGPGARKWILVEQTRLGNLRQALGGTGRLRVGE